MMASKLPSPLPALSRNRPRVLLDSNIWRYVHANAAGALIQCARNRAYDVLIAPAVIYEALRMKNAPLRNALARLMAHAAANRAGPRPNQCYCLLHRGVTRVNKNVMINHMKKNPSRSPRKAPKSYHHGDLRQALIQAAMTEIEKSGPEGINLTALAKAIGVSQPAPYRHFKDRGALLAAATAEGFRAFSAALEASVTVSSKRSKVAQMAQAYLDFGLRRSGIYRLMFASGLLAAAPPGSELQEAGQASFDLFVQCLGAPAPGFARERHAVQIWTAVHGLVMLAQQGFRPDESAQLSLPELVDAIVALNEEALAQARDGDGSGMAAVSR